jgi:hypothetical protein
VSTVEVATVPTPPATSIVLPGHGLLAEPDLAFHPDRPADRSVHPLEGLLEYGPFSRALVNTVIDPVRIATITPAGEGAQLAALVREFETSHQPRERRQYPPAFPGFQRVFGVRIVSSGATIELPATIDKELEAARSRT